jgi:hypothetical protein
MRRTSSVAWLVLPCLAVTACGGAPDGMAPDAQNQEAVVQRDVEAMSNAFYSGNLDLVLELTHPGIVESWGGPEKARDAMSTALLPFLQQGGRVEAFRFPAKPEFVLTDRALYAIVPTLTVVQLGNQRTESLKYHFGVLEPGARRWKYIDGTNITGSNVQTFFPDFPANHPFPKLQRKQL